MTLLERLEFTLYSPRFLSDPFDVLEDLIAVFVRALAVFLCVLTVLGNVVTDDVKLVVLIF
jgi:hypothetical protein